MRYRPVLVATLLCGVLLTGFIAAAGCQAAQPPAPAETARPPETAPETPEVIFTRELLVKEEAKSETEIEPGLYCLTATEGDGFFRLVVPGQEESLIREFSFDQRAWVEVKAGELLKVKRSSLETREDREMQACSASRLNNGFFLVGVDIYQGSWQFNLLERVVRIRLSAQSLTTRTIYPKDLSAVTILSFPSSTSRWRRGSFSICEMPKPTSRRHECT